LSFKIVKTISKAILHQNQNQHDKDEKIWLNKNLVKYFGKDSEKNMIIQHAFDE
jgi:hypothetical protein